jgi:hypothetical protein
MPNNPIRPGTIPCAARRLAVLLLPLVLGAGVSSCATLRSLAALSQVQFDLDRVASVTLAGVELDQVRSYEDLSALDVARVGVAIAQRRLPLEATLHVGAQNPDGNPVARLLALDWTLFLRDRETISGDIDRQIDLPSGVRTDIPVRVRLDLLEFFEGSAGDLIDLALSLSGVEGEPVEVRLEALPTVETALGPIRYPRPLILGGGIGGGGR